MKTEHVTKCVFESNFFYQDESKLLVPGHPSADWRVVSEIQEGFTYKETGKFETEDNYLITRSGGGPERGCGVV